MNRVTTRLTGIYAYLDNLIVTGKSWENHVERLCVLFTRLASYHFKANFAKSEFGHAKLVYVGHVKVGGQSGTPSQQKKEGPGIHPVPVKKAKVSPMTAAKPTSF
ncbi:hypothetical protein Pmani_007776 [Petrolisthes manimaculis]|uniref:Reverse transcriptase domain-containing protein n=1 Tax=Petrolisthes manimaculis TaxID=1843537 RepID=A0AAE1Q7L7_9EUCA|nr:hypothetical protein Pmani_007776 [Petrolisthes manimaculis]